MLSQFMGGIGPAIFLVLTGITLAFLMDRRERQGLAPLARWRSALRCNGLARLGARQALGGGCSVVAIARERMRGCID